MIKNIFIVVKVKTDSDGKAQSGNCRAFDSFHKAQRYIEENHNTLEPGEQFVIDGIPFDVEKDK